MKPGRAAEMTGAIPTFPPPRRGVEKWKTKSRFPTFPLVVLLTKPTKKGDPCGGSLHSPPSGSFFNEKMLWPVAYYRMKTCDNDSFQSMLSVKVVV
jgi:hypothetical protein